MTPEIYAWTVNLLEQNHIRFDGNFVRQKDGSYTGKVVVDLPDYHDEFDFEFYGNDRKFLSAIQESFTPYRDIEQYTDAGCRGVCFSRATLEQCDSLYVNVVFGIKRKLEELEKEGV